VDARQPSPFADREVPDPALCQVSPRSITFLEEAAATAVTDGPATPTSTWLPGVAGEPADDEIVAEIIATVRAVVACRNAGDQLRVDAFYSDAYFGRQVAMSGSVPPEFLEFLEATPSPLPEARQAAVYGVRDAEVLPDGRVRALVGLHIPPDDVALFTVFVREGDRWLIDEEALVPFDASPLATPGA